MAHTKGPWSKRRKLNYAIEIYGPDDQSICTVYPNGRRDVHAIATLIAAAPEMLAELESMRDDLALLVSERVRLEFYDFERIDAVIAKARGE